MVGRGNIGCEMLVLTPAVFQGIVQEHERLHALSADFGASLVEFLTGLSTPDDLSLSQDTFTVVVQGVPRDLRRLISSAALRADLDHDACVARRLRWMAWADRQRLQAEIDAGQCFVVELGSGGSGDLLRVLRVVALRVIRQDGRQLVQLGCPCKLPGGHMKEGETSEEARERVLTALLPALSGPTVLQQTSREVVRTNSRQYGLPTEYVREVHTLVIAESSARLWESENSDIAGSLRRLELIDLDLNGPKKFAWLSDEQWVFTRTPEGEMLVTNLLNSWSGCQAEAGHALPK